MSADNLKLAVEQFALTSIQVDDANLERAWEWKSYDEGIRFAFFRTYEELRELAGITQEELAILSLWWEDEPYTLEFRLHRFDSHFRQHTVQVEKSLATLGIAPNEAKRLLRLIYNALAEVEGAQIGAWDFGADQCQRLAEDISARALEIGQLIHP